MKFSLFYKASCVVVHYWNLYRSKIQ